MTTAVWSGWRALEQYERMSGVWVLGEGGWPTAVNGSRRTTYLEWVASQAPFTTYFTPSDCFVSEREIEEFEGESREALACSGGRCIIALEQRCTRS